MLPTLALCGALTLPLLCGFGVRHRYCVHSMSPSAVEISCVETFMHCAMKCSHLPRFALPAYCIQ